MNSLLNVYTRDSGKQDEVNEMGGTCSALGAIGNASKILVEKSRDKR